PSDVELSSTPDAFKTDIRLLGKVLGQVMLESEGETVFNVVEDLRRLAVKYRREGLPSDEAQLEDSIASLSDEEVNTVARAFGYFLHLSNLAEDRDQNRRKRLHELSGKAALRGSLKSAFDVLRNKGVSSAQIYEFLSKASIVPVLTAHPTEVQRKSTLDLHKSIAQVLLLTDQKQTPDERRQTLRSLYGLISTLWHTRMLRRHRLTVLDQIDNSLSYYNSTFLKAIPNIYADIHNCLNNDNNAYPTSDLAFLRMGSWIGGDRDGNPNVDANTLHQALTRQCRLIMTHYFAEIKELGTELSLSR